MAAKSVGGGEVGAGEPGKVGNGVIGEDDNNNKERAMFQFEGSKLTLEELIREWNARVLRRKAMLEKNEKVQYEEFEKLVKAKKLDSNLKKCTAFVRKMRQFNESSRAGLEADIRALNLTKYISEITGVIGELRLKPADVSGLVTICSEIHARYRDFSSQLLENFRNVLMVKNLGVAGGKLAFDLRLFSELLLAGVLPKDGGTKLVYNVVQYLVSLDKDGGHLIPVLVTVFRDQTDELLGIIPRDLRQTLEEHVCESQLLRCSSSVLSSENQAKLKAVLKKYFHLIKTVCGKKNDKVWGSAKYLRKLMETKGEVPLERQRCHEELAGELEKYHANVGKMANLLDVTAPKLRHLSINPDEEFEKALAMAGDGDEEEGAALFEDDETRRFYQDLPDLANYIFAKTNGLLNTMQLEGVDNSNKHKSNDEQDEENGEEFLGYESENSHDSSVDIDDLEPDSDESEAESDSFDADAEKAELMQDIQDNEELSPEFEGDELPSLRNTPEGESSSDDNSQEDNFTSCSSPGQTKLNFSSYLSNLKNCVNKRLIDKAAFDFVDNFKSKRCKSELARHLFSLPRQRMDLLRLCSRLAASVSQVYPEIGQEICELLRKDFRFLVLKRDQHRLETKLKVTRYIGELTMFSVFPKTEAFNCLKMLLRNFTHHQIEMICCFLDTCGRFLYNSRDTHRRMKLYLEEMLRRKTAQFLEPRYAYQVDCAYYQVCPPSNACIPKKVKTPLHAFMEYILWYDLSRDTLERANKALRMFDWKDSAKSGMAMSILSSPWRLSTSQLDTAAALLASLKLCRPDVVQAVIENISEVVRLGCEFESEDLNNMRMSTCQYFAHLYNYKCITTTSLLNVMYYLISYGVTFNNSYFSKMDPPDSLYRIRVVCHMLRIMGDFVSTPKSNRRLDYFLKYFQRYYLYKRGLPIWGDEAGGSRRFPHYVEEMFEDTIKRVRNKWQFRKTVDEAEEDILELNQKLKENVKSKQMKRAISGERQAVAVKVSAAPPPPQVLAEKPVNYADKVSGTMTSRSQQKTVVMDTLKEEENEEDEDEEEDLDEFEKELRALCSEGSVDKATSQVQRKRQDFPTAKLGGGKGESGMLALQYGMDKVKVTVLTKENNKPKEKTVEIEGKEEFLLTIKQRDEQEKKDKLEVKSRTLLLSRRQQEEEQIEKDRSMLNALGKLGKVQFSSAAVEANLTRGGGKGKKGVGANRRNNQQQYKK